MKKVFALLLALCIMCSYTVLASAEDSRVEIKFKVGDSVLSINGADVEVETPYIAGDGTTLVPLRVITEAFGAQVDWEGTTQTITLTYPNVNIVLQIGSIAAKVNDHSETLLEAPALSANGVTMVPLRFISETFGADVGYDSAAERISVVKESITGSNTVTGITNMPRTGDSYYQWSIDTPVDMNMTDRRLDGMGTEFTADDGSELHIDVYKYEADKIKPFDEEFSRVKDSFSRYTLMEAEKLTDNAGNKYMYFQAKNDEEIIDMREYYGKDNTTYEIVAFININDDVSTKNMILSIADSFKLGNIDGQTYDLSNVSDGMREIKSEKYKLSFKVPADYMQYTQKTENEFVFLSPDSNIHSTVHLGIFSKTDSVTAEKLAQSDHGSRMKAYNPELSKLTDVENTGDVYRYIQTVSGSSKHDTYNVDVFFEKGRYVYNMSVTVPSEKEAQSAEKIIESLKTEELDFAEIGKLLRNDPDDETMASNTVGNYKFSLPVSWKGASGSVSRVQTSAYVNSSTGSMISAVVKKDNDYTSGSLKSEAEDFREYMKDNPYIQSLGTIEYEKIGDKNFAHFTYKMANDENAESYATVYMTVVSKELIMFTLYEEDVFYKGEGIGVLKNALASITGK